MSKKEYNYSLTNRVIFSANTGVRISELINIKWTDVHFEKMTVRISNKSDFETKTKEERTIPLNEKAYAVLSGMEHRGEYVFSCLDTRRRDKHYVTRAFKKVLRSVGLGEGYSFHCLRHTFASHLVQRGVSIYVTSKLLGHASPKTTEIYAHLTPENYHDAVNLLDMEERKKYTAIVPESVSSE
ncbi:site-specific integrase [candidate division KSB1 bacterium]|nr:site-specific integrase [candidate division KSB1 bacterium]